MNTRIFVAFALDTSYGYKNIEVHAISDNFAKFELQYPSTCEKFVLASSIDQDLVIGYFEFETAEEAAEVLALKGSKLDNRILSFYETGCIHVIGLIPGEDVANIACEELEEFIKESLYEEGVTSRADIEDMLDDPWSVYGSLPEEGHKAIDEATVASVLKKFPLRPV